MAAYNDFLAAAMKELSDCLNQSAVEEIRARIIPELHEIDLPAWKDACVARADELFVAGSAEMKR